MPQVESVIKGIKKQVKQYEQDVNDAGRLIKLLGNMGQDVTEQKLQHKDMKSQLKRMKSAIDIDSEMYSND